MEEFNIEDYRDYENVTTAQYVAAKANIQKLAMDYAKKGDLKTAWHYAKIYFELSNLLDKRTMYGSKNGYEKKGSSK